MNVYELKTGRVRLVNPSLEYFVGKFVLPSWFVSEIRALLTASEPYAIAAGAALTTRYAPALALNYYTVNRDNVAALHAPVYSWTATMDTLFRDSIEESFLHEIDDILECFGTIKKLHFRQSRAAGTLARVLKQRRDDLESVRFVCLAMDRPRHLGDLAKLDSIADAQIEYLRESPMESYDKRLGVFHEQYPKLWWGMR